MSDHGLASSRFIWRFRLVACCLVLVAVTFSQRPGRIFGDTKFDLVANPAGLLARSLNLWDPMGGFGQVQNQAYGYLFPMGPFFWVGNLLSIPPWAIQRLWWSMLLVVAFLGVVKLAGVLGIGTPTSRILAGFAYALSPRILTVLGPISIEAWPSAVAPWVLIPLVVGSRRGSPLVAAAWSALAVAVVGGVNAVATFAVIPLGAVWLLTRERGRRRRALMVWWPTFVFIGTAWWLLPLLLLGRYSPPFLDYIETASITTIPTTLFDAIRGTSHWVPYVDRTWQAGNDLISTGYVALDGGVLLLFGLAGLSLARNRHRRFLVISVFVGMLMVTAGHAGAVQGWFVGAERSALDGVLAPLRNVHKFDPIIRLPLVLGLAHAVAVLAQRAADAVRRRQGSSERAPVNERVVYLSALVAVVAAVVGAAGPALTSRLGTWNDFEKVPAYWSKTATWLGENGRDSTAVLVPGSSFGYYIWGDPDDEPLQPLASSPWAVRNAVPLAPPGNIRMLDGLEAQLSSGRGSDGLAGYLRRAGIGHLVVRHDLRTADEPDPVVVHQALDRSPGIDRVAHFGPKVGSPARLTGKQRNMVVNDGWTREFPAVEIYEVEGATRSVTATHPPVVVGGPEDLLGLTAAGMLEDEPTVLGVDAKQGRRPDRLILTDGLRRRETNFARIHDGSSATLEAGDQGRRGAPARDYSIGTSRWETRAKILGAREISASSSRAFADTSGAVLRETLPFAAFDGLTETAWRSGPPASRPWLAIDLDTPRSVKTVTVTLADEVNKDVMTRLRIETDSGKSKVVRAVPGRPLVLEVPPAPTSKVTLRSMEPYPRELAVAELQIPGVDPDRTLELPSVPAAWGAPESILLSATQGMSEACVKVGEDTRCAPDRGGVGEEPGALDRTVRLGAGGTYEVSATATPTQSPALQGLIQRDQLLNIEASTMAVSDPRASGVAAIDGDVGTTWIADPEDKDPTLALRWLGKRPVRSIQLSLDRGAAASRPSRVEVMHPGGTQTVDLDRSGYAELKPFNSDQVSIRVIRSDKTINLASNGDRSDAAVGVSELRLGGLGLLPMRLSEVPFDVGCAFGPTVRVGGQLHPTTIQASPRQLFDGGMFKATVCGPATFEVPAGSSRVVLSPAPAFRGVQVLMREHTSDSATAAVTPATVVADSPVDRELSFPSGSGERIVAFRENQNPGWKARSNSGTPTSVTVDGWQQGWWVKPDATKLNLSYGPNVTYQVALGVGGLLLALLAGISWFCRRRGSPHPAVGPRAISPVLLAGGGVLALGLMAGWTGLGCGLAAVAAAVAARRWLSAEAIAWGSGALVAAAAGFYWLRPLGSADGWAGTMVAPQLLVAAGLALSLCVDLPRPRGRSLNRSSGRSTSR